MNTQKILRRSWNLTAGDRRCTIYKVHKHLRSVNDTAYDPQIISIGPYHHGKENLKMMEKQKKIYMQSLLKDKDANIQAGISDIIKEKESNARDCYAEDIDYLCPPAFTEMLVLDGCFIIQLLLKFSEINNPYDENDPYYTWIHPIFIAESDPIFQMEWIMKSLQHDLMLFENQIPFFILVELFKQILDRDLQELMELLFRFFKSPFPGKGYERSSSREPDKIRHLLDLVHSNWSPYKSFHILNVDKKSHQKRQVLAPKKGVNHMRYIDTAKELKNANVWFVKSYNEEGNLFDVTFENGIMTMSTLSIGDSTESFLRNMIAYEQYFQDYETSFVTDYVLFLDFLIDTPRDVVILSRANIIENWLGDDEVTANMVNKLADWIDSPSYTFAYVEILRKVNAHCNKHRNRHWAALRQKYLNGPWGIISIIVAFTILLLGLIQAVCSILQVVNQ